MDLNPYATAIARFRLVVAALRACEIRRLAEAPAFKLNLATGDSLIHARPERGQFTGFEAHDLCIAHVYDTEDSDELRRILGRGYHVVVGNPPYINVADAALRHAYRRRYESCHREYALNVPFMERFFELARVGDDGRPQVAGYVGKITANSFMKREFGARLVEHFLPSVDVTTIIDTGGAYIPGHGTPTLILFGRARPPAAAMIRVLDAVRGEPSKPIDPARSEVWTSILLLIDQPGEQDRFIRSSDVARGEFAEHPMTLGIGRDLRKELDASGSFVRGPEVQVGFTSLSGDDDFFVLPSLRDVRRLGVTRAVEVVPGTAVRDWMLRAGAGFWPHREDWSPDLTRAHPEFPYFWRARTALAQRKRFGVPMIEKGLTWYEWRELYVDKLRTPLTIAWGEVATHNHFVLDRGGKVFKQTAPVIKLPENAREDDHLRLLGVLNSATACFWLKQVCQSKGGDYVGQEGARLSKSPWEDRYALNASNVADLPLPDHRKLDLPKRLDAVARARAALLDDLPATDLRASAGALRERDAASFAEMVSLQEELDWQVMGSFGLVPDDLPMAGLDAPPLLLGERAFEIVLARQVARAETETTWFERHGSTPITEPPDHWPSDYRDLVQRRIELIDTDPNVGLIERPEHKRRWASRSFDEQLNEALRNLILDRLEERDLWADLRLKPVSELADVVRTDARLVDACALIAGSADVDVGDVVESLVLDQAVPFLAAYRHTDAGLRKRAIWERVWELQRAEDRIDARTELADDDPDRLTKAQASELKADDVGRIPVPPRYAKSDFRQVTAWNLRGKLDVPKERFVRVHGAERGANPSPIVGWAGWDERARARAMAARILELQESEAADAERLTPLLAGVLELLPWIHQWHPEPDPEYGHRPAGAYLEDWLDGMLSTLGLTREALRNWHAPAPARGRARGAATTTTAA